MFGTESCGFFCPKKFCKLSKNAGWTSAPEIRRFVRVWRIGAEMDPGGEAALANRGGRPIGSEEHGQGLE